MQCLGKKGKPQVTKFLGSSAFLNLIFRQIRPWLRGSSSSYTCVEFWPDPWPHKRKPGWQLQLSVDEKFAARTWPSLGWKSLRPCKNSMTMVSDIISYELDDVFARDRLTLLPSWCDGSMILEVRSKAVVGLVWRMLKWACLWQEQVVIGAQSTWTVVPCLQNLKISNLKRHYPQCERIPADKITSRRKAGCQKLYPLLQLLSQWRWACICTDWEALAGPSLRELIQLLHVVAMFIPFLHMPNGSKWIQIASESFQVLVARSDGDGLQQNSFVNAISTPKGGTCLGRISLHHRFIRMLDSSATEVKSFSPDLFKPCELAAQCVGFLLCYISVTNAMPGDPYHVRCGQMQLSALHIFNSLAMFKKSCLLSRHVNYILDQLVDAISSKVPGWSMKVQGSFQIFEVWFTIRPASRLEKERRSSGCTLAEQRSAWISLSRMAAALGRLTA